MSSTLIPAATVILGRDGDARPEVLMVRRSSRLAFAGGMWVFPGGRLDPEDFGDDADDLDAAERRAAAREAFEETRVVIEPAALVRWSHWTPPDLGQSHRFSTAFFIGADPGDEVVVDHGEIREHRWLAPAEALALHAEGQIELAPPTFITLLQLRAAGSLTEWITRGTEAVEHFSTVIAAEGETMVALYHGDAGYERADPTAAGRRHRLVMASDGWRYLRD